MHYILTLAGKARHHQEGIMHISHLRCRQKCNIFHSCSVVHGANSCHVHQKTPGLVRGNRFTAAQSEFYLHKLPQNT